MLPQALLDLLSEVLPVGIIVLISVGLYFMKSHQDNVERLYKLTLEQQKTTEGQHRYFQDTLKAERDSSISFLQKYINEIKADQQALKAEVAQERDAYRELQAQYSSLQEKVNSMLKERFDERDSTQEIIGKLEEGVDQLPDRSNQEIIQLKQDFIDLRKSLEKMEKVDEDTRNWLQDIRTYSQSRTSLAQRAAEHARLNS